MFKKLVLLGLLICIAFLAMGCPFIISSAHTRAHSKAINEHTVAIHQFFDRHFWLYDWSDPYVN